MAENGESVREEETRGTVNVIIKEKSFIPGQPMNRKQLHSVSLNKVAESSETETKQETFRP